jgi:hypothetical protein
MKASELKDRLENLVEIYGDLPIKLRFVVNDEDGEYRETEEVVGIRYGNECNGIGAFIAEIAKELTIAD